MDKWIKCAERLPELEERVLAWDGEKIELAYRDCISMFEPLKIVWTYYDYIEWEGVTHWTELPEAPKDE